MEELITQLPVARVIAEWVHSGTEFQQTVKTSISHGVWALMAMTIAWRLRRRIELPLLTPMLVLVIGFYAEREITDYITQGVGKAFDCAMDFIVPAVTSGWMYRTLLRHRHRFLDGPV